MKSAYLEQKIAKYASILLFQSITLKNELFFLKDYLKLYDILNFGKISLPKSNLIGYSLGFIPAISEWLWSHLLIFISAAILAKTIFPV